MNDSGYSRLKMVPGGAGAIFPYQNKNCLDMRKIAAARLNIAQK